MSTVRIKNAKYQSHLKIPNKRELQQTAVNHLSHIDLKEFMSIYQKWAAKPYSLLVNDVLDAIFYKVYKKYS